MCMLYARTYTCESLCATSHAGVRTVREFLQPIRDLRQKKTGEWLGQQRRMDVLRISVNTSSTSYWWRWTMHVNRRPTAYGLCVIIQKPNRLHTVHEIRPFLHMSHVAWSVCLCVGHTDFELCMCNNGWTDRDVVWGLTYVGIRNQNIRLSQGLINPFAAARGTRRWCDQLSNYLLTISTIYPLLSPLFFLP